LDDQPDRPGRVYVVSAVSSAQHPLAKGHPVSDVPDYLVNGVDPEESSDAFNHSGRVIATAVGVAPDLDSQAWIRDLQHPQSREAAVARLHELLLRLARNEAARRRLTLPDRASEVVDDLCCQAANDAVMAILAKLDTYRGTARFTTWAAKFVIFETSTRLRQHAWRQRRVELDDTVWDRLPDTAPGALQEIENEQLLSALSRAVVEHLTERQRLIFQSVTMEEVPIDVLAERLDTTRGAIYKTLHDARAKLRRALIDAGHGEPDA
jgi:RNA polymerase sigma-70 factor (ECF subfamily)